MINDLNSFLSFKIPLHSQQTELLTYQPSNLWSAVSPSLPTVFLCIPCFAPWVPVVIHQQAFWALCKLPCSSVGSVSTSTIVQRPTWRICCSSCELPLHRFIMCCNNSFVLSVFPAPLSPLPRKSEGNSSSHKVYLFCPLCPRALLLESALLPKSFTTFSAVLCMWAQTCTQLHTVGPMRPWSLPKGNISPSSREYRYTPCHNFWMGWTGQAICSVS